MGLKDKLGEHVGVIVVDMTKDYLEDYSSAYSSTRVELLESQVLRFLNKDAKRMIKVQERVIAQCGYERVPLYFLITTEEDTNKCKYDPIKPLLDASVMVERPLIVPKKQNNGFYETDLDDFLKRDRISTMLLLGINSGRCVIATASGAIKKGYRIATGKGLILDHDQRRYKRSIEWFKQKGLWIKDPHRSLC